MPRMTSAQVGEVEEAGSVTSWWPWTGLCGCWDPCPGFPEHVHGPVQPWFMSPRGSAASCFLFRFRTQPCTVSLINDAN